jgi:hypothetical protein
VGSNLTKEENSSEYKWVQDTQALERWLILGAQGGHTVSALGRLRPAIMACVTEHERNHKTGTFTRAV